MSYDSHHVYRDRIYRIHRSFFDPDGSLSAEFCSLAPSFVPLLEDEFPEMERVVRMAGGWKTTVGPATRLGRP